MDVLQITYTEWANLGILFLILALIIRKKIAFCLSLGAVVTGFILWGTALYLSPNVYGAIWVQLGIFLASFLVLLAIFPQEWVHLKSRDRIASSFHPHKGQILVLPSPIVKGKSKIDIEGKKWVIIGPDLNIGTAVKIQAIEGCNIFVQKHTDQ